MTQNESNPTGAEWLIALAERLDVDPPDQETIDTLLELAGVAAHASERTAAPIACWMVGRTGTDPQTALTIAREI